MGKALIIGCGGVASVAISKCCQVSDVFTELCIASRTKSKCDALAAKLAPTTRTKITTAQVDADDVQQLCDLINAYKPDPSGWFFCTRNAKNRAYPAFCPLTPAYAQRYTLTVAVQYQCCGRMQAPCQRLELRGNAKMFAACGSRTIAVFYKRSAES